MNRWRLVSCATVLGLLQALVAGASTTENQVTIASWNVCNLGANTSVVTRAEVIRNFDIVALQEVKSPEGLGRLLACVETLTGSDWDYVPSLLVGSGKAVEYYAFIYRTDRVAYVSGSSGTYPEALPTDFSREPFYATFRAGEFDFTLITVHITWSAFGSQRTAECRRLRSVWDYVQNLDQAEDDLILLGDFNRDRPTHSAFDQLWQVGLTPLLSASGTRTTFGRTLAGGSWYDNIWIDPTCTTTSELSGQLGAGTPSLNSYGAGCSECLRGVSDHCPVWATFRTDSDDDSSAHAPNPGLLG